MFASKSLTEHLLRGGVGAALIVLALLVAPSEPIVSIAALALALVSLRGCPTCWTIGLVQTVVARLRGGPRPEACVAGRCAADRRSV